MKHTVTPPPLGTTHPAMYQGVSGRIYITDASGHTLFYVSPDGTVGLASGDNTERGFERLPTGTTLTFTQE